MFHFMKFFARSGDDAAGEGAGPAPFGAYERMLALRYMRSRRNRWLPSAIAGLSVTGIVVGVMSLIVVMSVMNGMRDEMISKLIGVNGHIFIQPIDTPLTDYREVTDELKKIKGITFAFPLIENAAGISSPRQQTGALVRGVTEADLKRLPGVEGNVRQGTLDHFTGDTGLVIGEKLAETLGVQVGDKVSILTAKGAQTPFGVTPRLKAYPVKAIYESGLYDFDQLIVFMPLSEAQLFFDRPGEANLIEAFVAHPDDVDAARARIVQTITRPIMLTDWRQRSKTFFDVLKVESDSIFLILSIIVMVASLLIVQGLILLVKDKGRDIAILRTMGGDARLDPAGVHPHRPVHRRHRGASRRGARRAAGLAARPHPQFHQSDLRPQLVPGQRLSPLATALVARSPRGRRDHPADPLPVLPRHALSGVARGAARPGGGPAP